MDSFNKVLLSCKGVCSGMMKTARTQISKMFFSFFFFFSLSRISCSSGSRESCSYPLHNTVWPSAVISLAVHITVIAANTQSNKEKNKMRIFSQRRCWTLRNKRTPSGDTAFTHLQVFLFFCNDSSILSFQLHLFSQILVPAWVLFWEHVWKNCCAIWPFFFFLNWLPHGQQLPVKS